MTIQLIESVISQFLTSEKSEVLCVTGKWGVGKTYTWKKLFAAHKCAGDIKLPSYSYCSVFGINSIDELKQSILENTVSTKDSTPLSIESFDKHVLQRIAKKAESFWKNEDWKHGSIQQTWKFLGKSWIVNRFVPEQAFVHFANLSLQKYIVCIDDIERRGSGLKLNQIFGLISYLKTERDCKVVVLMNKEKEPEENNEVSLGNYKDKVIDKYLDFTLKPKETASIVFGAKPSDIEKRISEKFTILDVSNIRIWNKAYDLIQQVMPIIKEYPEHVSEQFIDALILFVWCEMQPDEAIPIKFITSNAYSAAFMGLKSQKFSEQEKKWAALLGEYNFTHASNLDLLLIKGVQEGHFTSVEEELRQEAKVLYDQEQATKQEIAYRAAWGLYHNSFGDNEAEVLKGLYDAFFPAAGTISAGNLNGVISFFKEMGKSDEAAAMLKHYMDVNKDKYDLFNLEEVFFNDVNDPEIIELFNKKYAEHKDNPDAKDVMTQIQGGWNEKQINILTNLPVAEYCKIFKASQGEELRKRIYGCLQFERIMNAGEKEKTISAKARKALEIIGAESPLNAKRVGKYGVNVIDANNNPEDKKSNIAPASPTTRAANQ